MALSCLQMLMLSFMESLSLVFPIPELGSLAIVRNILGLPLDGSTDGFYIALLRLAVALSIFFVFRREYLVSAVAFTHRAKHSWPREKLVCNQRMAVVIVSAMLPLVIWPFLRKLVSAWSMDLLIMAAVTTFTGFLLFFSERMGKGGRTLRDTTLADGLVLGSAQMLSLIPGCSRTGLVLSAGYIRGLAPEQCFADCFLIAGPLLLVQAIHGMIRHGGQSFSPMYLLGMLLTAVLACCFMKLLRLCLRKDHFGNFSYLLWGTGLMAYIFYLIG